MLRIPSRPVDENGTPVFPAATEDDVQGHQFIATEPSEDEPQDKKPGPQLAV